MNRPAPTLRRWLVPAALAALCACSGDEPSDHGDTTPPETAETASLTGDTGPLPSTAETADTAWATGDTARPGPTGGTGGTGDTGPGTSWQMVVAGQSATCGLDQDGEAYCLVDGPFALPAPPAGPFVDLAVAFGTACAIDTNEAIQCWGCDFVGSMCQPPTDTGYVQVEGADSYLCARKADGTVSCWGYGPEPRRQETFTDFDLAVTGFTGLRPDGTLGHAGGEAPDEFTGADFVELGVGRSFACGLDAAGDMSCSQYAPRGLPQAGLSQIDGMSDTFCWLDTDGHVGCFPDARNPNPARDGFDPATTEFISVSAGDRHACGVTVDGQGLCWPAGEVFTAWPARP